MGEAVGTKVVDIIKNPKLKTATMIRIDPT